MNIKQANTINEVIQLLDEIIEKSKVEQSAIGLFATLYREVTVRVKEGIHDGSFQNGERMEKLDVIFANRYLKAYYQYQAKEKPSECWGFAFEQAEDFWPIVLQHLLLGINAHVNLDLGIASAQVSTIEDIGDLKSDFDQINAILSNLVGGVEKCLIKIWPTLTWVLKVTGKIDNFFIDFSMETARNGAWKFANEFVAVPENEREACTQLRDQRITEIARLVSNPGYFVSAVFKFIRLFERGTVAQKIIDMQIIEEKNIECAVS
ncbi:hypothetical protein IRZ71_08260 [Flavobacterium sp. ANB]|uniref:DUF5995 family protein n=1 Tax=unclassified Flavobacterium TaxID=196869 RepID=UPI0012B86CD9|nr:MULTISPECIES: DUF5995 family protein [unclassified Flavobacterium]MBF4516332.1 hypothetical protein [Flavobacterium sp. ANB]MTD69771.1 hypothetical protein [Flavobacterium sp. LC2016-13]